MRSQNIVFTLQTTNRDGLEVGQGSSALGRTFTLTIFDDCILGGTYNARRGTSTNDLRVTVTSPDCETYTLSNWNVFVFNTDEEMDLTFVDNGDNTLTIPEQEEEDLNSEFATIKGTGSVDPNTREIILKITLLDFEDQPEETITLTPH